MNENMIVVNDDCYIAGCDSEHWGDNCSMTCGHCASGTPCNVKNGQCELGCATGFIAPPMCNDGMENVIFLFILVI